MRALLLQAPGIGATFVAQRIVAGGDHQGRRQAGQRGGAQRRHPPVAAARLVGRVVIEEPFHGLGIEAVAVVVAAVGVGARHRVGDRIGEQLQAKLGPPWSRAQIAAAAARLPPALSPPMASRAASMPTEAPLAATHCRAGHDIVEGAREARLGRQPIVDGATPRCRPRGRAGRRARRGCRDCRTPSRRHGRRPAPAARRLSPPTLGPIEPDRQVAAGSGNGAVDHRHARRAAGPARRGRSDR